MFYLYLIGKIVNVNYVKKVIFPLEILPVVSLMAAFFHSAISLTVLLYAIIAVNGCLPWTIVLIPIVLLPLVTLVLGCAWILGCFYQRHRPGYRYCYNGHAVYGPRVFSTIGYA